MWCRSMSSTNFQLWSNSLTFTLVRNSVRTYRLMLQNFANSPNTVTSRIPSLTGWCAVFPTSAHSAAYSQKWTSPSPRSWISYKLLRLLNATPANLIRVQRPNQYISLLGKRLETAHGGRAAPCSASAVVPLQRQ